VNSSSVEKVGKPRPVTPKNTTGLEIGLHPPHRSQELHNCVKPFSPSSVASSICWTTPTPAKVDPASGSEIGQTTRTKMGLELAPDVGETNSVQVVACPPLAGPNVMNVNVIAAECAPWSKTSTVPPV